MMSDESPQSLSLPKRAFPHLTLIGALATILAISLYSFGTILGLFNFVLSRPYILTVVAENLVWYSGIPLIVGLFLIAFDLLFLLENKRDKSPVRFDVVNTDSVTVCLTAYNDEESIALAVKDFLSHPKVARVIVVDNNSKDRTSEFAKEAGAIVVLEEKPGYGQCVYRCYLEGIKYSDTELTLLCEGDMTFRAFDIDKFLAYIPHADIVNGTRIVEQLREFSTQLTSFMYYGNFAVGKLLELIHLGKGTFTDVGTTYKLCRNDALRKILPYLDPEINLEFNAYFMDSVLTLNHVIVECPVTFSPRIGLSKGGNVNDIRALKVGLRMIRGLLLGFKRYE